LVSDGAIVGIPRVSDVQLGEVPGWEGLSVGAIAARIETVEKLTATYKGDLSRDIKKAEDSVSRAMRDL
jgi:hypothetical protein